MGSPNNLSNITAIIHDSSEHTIVYYRSKANQKSSLQGKKNPFWSKYMHFILQQFIYSLLQRLEQ